MKTTPIQVQIGSEGFGNPPRMTLSFGGKNRLYEAQTLVDSLLGTRAPRVYMQGASFYHRAIWADRLLISKICLWSRQNPGAKPDRAILSDIAFQIRKEIEDNDQFLGGKNSKDYIVIASLPVHEDYQYGIVSNGGTIHEVAHGLYTRRKPYQVEEIESLILDRWDDIPDWGAVERALLDATNMVEDPRIEIAISEEYPGSASYLLTLRKWSWDRGQKDIGKMLAKDPTPPDPYNLVSILLITMAHEGFSCKERDDFIDLYKELLPNLYELVSEGDLAPILAAMRDLRGKDHNEALRIAIQFISILTQSLGKDQIPLPGSPEGKGRISCPQCGSKRTRTVLLPSTDQDRAEGLRRATTHCDDCGASWSQRVQIHECGEGGDGEGQPVVDMDQVQDQVRKLKKKADKQRAAQPGSASSEDGDGDGDEEGDAAGGKDEGEEDEEDDTGEGEKESDKDGDDPNGKGNPGSDKPRKPLSPLEEMAQEAIGKVEQDDPLVNLIGEELDKFVQSEWDKETKRCDAGAPYRPYAPGVDKVTVTNPDRESEALQKVNRLLEEVAQTTTEIRERLRRLVVSLRATRVIHGIRRGIHLSERRIADVGGDLLLGNYPRDPFKIRANQANPKFSAIVVLDQSGSMAGWIEKAIQVMLALVDPIDDLGYPVAAIGFQDSYNRDNLPKAKDPMGSEYHRSPHEGVQVHLYKNFDEPFEQAKPRFAICHATGGTPMAEGVQAALEWISARKEPIRFIFVVTDGCPNSPTEEVIKQQVADAVGQGIMIVGVGVGAGTGATVQIFSPHGISVKNIEDVPDPLLTLITDRIESLR